MMNCSSLSRTLIFAIAVFAANLASAALVGMSDPSVAGPDSGDGFNITLDDVSGLKWLDLTITRGMSRNQVLASPLITSGDYRYATDVEVNNLFLTNLGVAFVGSEQTSPFFANFTIIQRTTTLMNFFGVTNTQIPLGSYGLVDAATTLPGGHNQYAARMFTLPAAGLLRITRGPDESDAGAFGFGSFLVQHVPGQGPGVPEPATLWLLAMGLFRVIRVTNRRWR